MRWRVRRGGSRADGADAPAGEFVEVDVTRLSGVFAAPAWLRDLGAMAWLLVGATLLIAGIVWLLSLTQTIFMPLAAAVIVAAVASPIVRRLQRLGIPRGIAAALILLALVVAAVAIAVLILVGVTNEAPAIASQLAHAADTFAGWVRDLGADPTTAEDAKKDVSDSVGAMVPALLNGVAGGIKGLSSLVFFLALTALSLFFLLKDGPAIRAWSERHSGVPEPVAHVISQRTLGALRGYFVGVTIVAGFNAVVVGCGALLLGVPLAGTIAVVTFLGAYVPYLGAWGAGAFSVFIALGGAGTDAAAAMAVIQLLANGLLQQLVQPVAYGAALGIHPLAVLVVTIAGGALFGAPGLILAAPLTSALVRISGDLARAGAKERPADAAPTGPDGAGVQPRATAGPAG